MLNVTEKIVEMSLTAPPMINEAGWEIYFGAANAAGNVNAAGNLGGMSATF